ncbi:NAD(P)H-dependent oxidoreductase subunit E [Myxococcota bacterium]|nr:NAD(P)H-dependent oxidoreductase subunit E [Myxococcota bacterium]MBU1533989.1 NAD(P)H-dependent oxidoreductase subunit E [Myxococcota bacterium]
MDTVKIDAIIEKNNADETAILAILQDIQGVFNYLPREAMEYVAKKMEVPFSRIAALATFFSSFALEERGKHIVTICMGTACHVRGAPRVLEEVERELHIKNKETTADKNFTIETVNCVGACALGPLVIVDGDYHGNISTSGVADMIKQYKPDAQE